VLNSLEIAGTKFFNGMFTHHLKRVSGEQYRIHSLIESLQETMRDLRETNNSLLSTKQNEAMKVLTIMAFVTFPLSLVASIFGMNTVFLPFVGQKYDFWMVMGIMAALTISFFIFFKRNKWL
jgi:magnesium transporter